MLDMSPISGTGVGGHTFGHILKVRYVGLRLLRPSSSTGTHSPGSVTQWPHVLFCFCFVFVCFVFCLFVVFVCFVFVFVFVFLVSYQKNTNLLPKDLIFWNLLKNKILFYKFPSKFMNKYNLL